MKKKIEAVLNVSLAAGLFSANDSLLLLLISKAVCVDGVCSAEFVLGLSMATFCFFAAAAAFMAVACCMCVVLRDDINKKIQEENEKTKEKEGNKVEQKEKDY